MAQVLSAAGRAFIRAFVASLIVYGPGLLNAPNLHALVLVGVAALIASIVAGLRAIQAYIPVLTTAAHIGKPYGDWLDAFVLGFIGSLIVTLTGWLNAPDLSTWRAIGVAALVGAFTAGLRAVQGALTTGEHPAPAMGVDPPPNP